MPDVGDALRRKLVPSANYTVAELRDGLIAALEGRSARRRTLMLAATLIAGVNDSDEDARTLAAFVGPLVDAAQKVNVDLIPVNPTSHAPDYARPSDARPTAYAAALKAVEPRVHCALRIQRGDDESAACGQLAVDRRPALVA